MNSENSKTSDPHRLLLSLSDKINFDYIIKTYETVNANPSIMIYVNKIENSFISKIETGYCLEVLMSDTMKYLETLKVRSLRIKMVKMCLI